MPIEEHLPAVVEEKPREIGTTDVDSWIHVASDVVKLANLIAPTEFVPESLRDSAPATAAAILYGREVGLPPMTALTQTHVIKGRPAMSAEAMRALVLAAGHELEVTETNRARCEIRGRRHGREKWTTVVWTLDDAKHLRGDNWTNYPRQMLQARASAELCRMVFPDVIHGFRALEEFDDLDDVQDTRPEPAVKGTRVARKRAAAKALPSAPAPVEEKPTTPSGPPLPGEDGYQTSAGSPTAGPDATEPPQGEEDGGTKEPPAAEGQGEGPEPAGDSEEGGREVAPDPGGTGATKPTTRPEPPRPAPLLPDPVVPERAVKAARRPRLLTRAQQRGIEASLTHLGVDDDRDERHLIATTILGREVDSFKTLTFDEASTLMDTFGRIETKEQLTAILDQFDAKRAATADRWNQGDRS